MDRRWEPHSGPHCQGHPTRSRVDEPDADPVDESDDAPDSDSAGDLDTSLGAQVNWIDDAGVLNVFAGLTLGADQLAPLTVRSDDIVVDCAGHAITGVGIDDTTVNNGRGINIEARTNVEIRNCVVTNFSVGVLVGRGSTEIVVRNSTAHGNREGFRIDDASASLLDNVAVDSEFWGFIVIDGTAGSVLERNVADDNRAIGFVIQKSPNNDLDANRATGNDIAYNLVAADDNHLTNNFARGGAEGFFVSGSDDNLFEGTAPSAGRTPLAVSSSMRHRGTPSRTTPPAVTTRGSTPARGAKTTPSTAMRRATTIRASSTRANSVAVPLARTTPTATTPVPGTPTRPFLPACAEGGRGGSGVMARPTGT